MRLVIHNEHFNEYKNKTQVINTVRLSNSWLGDLKYLAQ